MFLWLVSSRTVCVFLNLTFLLTLEAFSFKKTVGQELA